MLRSVLVLLLLFTFTGPALAGEKTVQAMEARYQGLCFSARFHQISVLSAMNISEKAEGRVIFAHPGRMRWEYETPEPRLILTDGTTLWIHSPLEKEVLTGAAEPYFGKGKGGRFLSDMSSLREDFTYTRISEPGIRPVRIRFLPNNPEPGLTELFIEAEESTGLITGIETVNAYGDVTRIRFFGEEHHTGCKEAMFHFVIPEGNRQFELGEP
ncbi:outer membrane lipoprotein carrier protein LolA [Desulfobotulus sp. H1]|uniref:Outer membrane lipoprotein carrier protein LolA n=1 Tax=Desulfobotulus pelophilus TaxID=2823377 RepID=A0ABT3NCM2_9BACT|nr:outer membrane lipoprotein carrier protein LolA [Desulfobotulus pelophilus]MCW7754936.1 outer membrane lipoprotein carrier protein LolA [Desulfobotulus pelophilus]